MKSAQAEKVAEVIAKGIQNASTMALANQQGQNISPFDAYSHTVDGLSKRMEGAINDPQAFLLGDPAQQARVDAAMMPSQWQSSSANQWIDSTIAQHNALKDQFTAIGEAEGVLPSIGASFAFLISVEQMLSTMLSVIPFPAFPAVRIMDMDVGLPHAHAHPPNLTPPNPGPVPLPSTGPLIPIPFFSGASQTLINNMPAARCGDMGLSIWCGGYFPMYEVFLGSSNVWIEGARAARVVIDITKHCLFTIPKPSDPPLGPMIGTTISSSTNVLIGGIPMPSLLTLGMGAAFRGLGKLVGQSAQVFSRLTAPLRRSLKARLPPSFFKCNILRAEPVNVVTGEVVVDQQDYAIPGRIPIEWDRHYGSHGRRIGVCGYGWETPADIRLEIDDEGGVILHRGAEGIAIFGSLPRENEALMEPINGGVLSRQQKHLVVQLKEGVRYYFRIPKTPTNEIVIESITDLHGNYLSFVRDEHGLKQIVESAGRRIEVTSRNGLILAMQLYHPDEKNLRPLIRYEYDLETHDLLAVYDALDHPYRFKYQNHCLIQHTDRNGLSFYYQYDAYSQQGRCVHAWGDGGLYNYYLKFNPLKAETQITNSLGHISSVEYTEDFLIVKETDPLNGVTRYEYDEVGRTRAVIDPANKRTEYHYDDRGNLLTLTRPDGHTITTAFNAANQAVRITDPNGAVWQQEWNPRGLLTKQVSPLGAESRYHYDAHGQLVSFINPRDARTTLDFDPYGNLTRLTDALNHFTEFTYDPLGNVTAKTDPLGQRTRYAYDPKGRLIQAVLPSGATIACAYDGEDNLIRYQDENGAVTRLEYCGLGEIKSRIQPDGHVVEYHYDTEERLIGVTNQRGERYELRRDPLGRIVEEVDYWGQARCYAYTAAGYLKKSADPLGRIIHYETDPLGRILKKLLPDPVQLEALQTETFAYDPNGNLTTCENAAIRIERRFDAEGRLLEEQQGDTCLVSNAYDRNGNRIARTTQREVAGRNATSTVRYRYDALDQVIAVEVPGHDSLQLTRNALGQVTQEDLSRRLQRHFAYNADGYLTAQQVRAVEAPIIEQRYRYDPAGNLQEKQDSAWGIERYTYDPLGRLTAHLNPEGQIKHYLNDPAGDRLTTQVISGPPEHHSDSEWRREGEYESMFYRFDRAGNLTQRVGPEDKTELFWDANQRLMESITNGQRTTYHYDPLGRRISKQTDGVMTHFCWDGDALLGDAQVVGSENQAPNLQRLREWVYYPETFEPLALLQDPSHSPGTLYLYHNDPNGCPTRLLDPKGQVVWAAQYSAWGAVERLHVNRVDNPIRLQGQYEDEETGLCYNRHRYFEPSIGSYIAIDPIRLTGGTNLYGLGPNVFRWTDPYGLTCDDILFGQRRIAPHFRSIDADIPEYLRGRRLSDVVKDLKPEKAGKPAKLHPDQLEVKYFVHPETGQRIAESNRTLAALSMANKKPTKVREVPATGELLSRLDEPPLRRHGEVFSMPGRSIPVTPGVNDTTIIDVARLP